jgi:transcriptional regulator with XRE-family HTH domain
MPRGKQPHTAEQKLLMARVAKWFSAKKEALQRDGKSAVEEMARELGVSRASLYNYLNEDDVPNGQVLERARELWGMKFDDESLPLDKIADVLRRNSARRRKKTPDSRQYVLSFLEAVTPEDVTVISVKPKGPSSVKLVLNIKFGS